MKKWQPNFAYLKTHIKITYNLEKLTEMHFQYCNNIAMIFKEVKI